jgi:hypothetical protein
MMRWKRVGRRSGRKCEISEAKRIILCRPGPFRTDFAPQQTGNLGISKKLHKPDFFSLTPQIVGPITPLIERGGAVASGG